MAKAKDSLCVWLEVSLGINQSTLAYSSQRNTQLLMLADKWRTRHRKRSSQAAGKLRVLLNRHLSFE